MDTAVQASKVIPEATSPTQVRNPVLMPVASLAHKPAGNQESSQVRNPANTSAGLNNTVIRGNMSGRSPASKTMGSILAGRKDQRTLSASTATGPTRTLLHQCLRTRPSHVRMRSSSD